MSQTSSHSSRSANLFNRMDVQQKNSHCMAFFKIWDPNIKCDWPWDMRVGFINFGKVSLMYHFWGNLLFETFWIFSHICWAGRWIPLWRRRWQCKHWRFKRGWIRQQRSNFTDGRNYFSKLSSRTTLELSPDGRNYFHRWKNYFHGWEKLFSQMGEIIFLNSRAEPPAPPLSWRYLLPNDTLWIKSRLNNKLLITTRHKCCNGFREYNPGKDPNCSEKSRCTRVRKGRRSFQNWMLQVHYQDRIIDY